MGRHSLPWEVGLKCMHLYVARDWIEFKSFMLDVFLTVRAVCIYLSFSVCLICGMEKKPSFRYTTVRVHNRFVHCPVNHNEHCDVGAEMLSLWLLLWLNHNSLEKSQSPQGSLHCAVGCSPQVKSLGRNKILTVSRIYGNINIINIYKPCIIYVDYRYII